MRRSGTFSLAAIGHSLLAEHHATIAELATMVENGVDLGSSEEAKTLCERVRKAFDLCKQTLEEKKAGSQNELHSAFKFWERGNQEILTEMQAALTPHVPVSDVPSATLKDINTRYFE